MSKQITYEVKVERAVRVIDYEEAFINITVDADTSREKIVRLAQQQIEEDYDLDWHCVTSEVQEAYNHIVNIIVKLPN